MKTKILFLIQDLKHGGAEKVLVNLVNNMDLTEYDVSVKTLFDTGIHRNRIRPEVKYLPGLKWEFRGNSHIIRALPARWLFKFFVREHYDVIVAFLEGTSTKVLSGCTDLDTKKIAWVHIELKSIKTCFKNSRKALEAYQKFDQIISVSESVKAAFEKAAGMRLQQMKVLYNVNETDSIIQKSRESIDDVVFDSKEINLISVAKLVPSKGFDRLISVMKRLQRDGYIKLHLYLLGIGEDEKKLKKQIEDNELDQKVTLLGFRDNPYKYVASADLYVCSSRREGFSTAVTEALVVGTPVVSTCCSGAYELLGEHNEYGIVVSNDEEGIYKGIVYMLEEDRYKTYRSKALERGKQFSTVITTNAVEQMIQAVIK